MIENIRRALDKHLADMPPSVDVAWPNTGFEPNGAYIRPTLLPIQPSQSELGEAGRNVHEGIYQLDIFYPPGVGRGGAETLASSLVQRFKRGTNIIHQDTTVRCDMSGITSAPTEPNWYRIIVRVDYRAYLPN